MKRSRKLLAILLGIIMTLGMLPAVASADEGTVVKVTNQDELIAAVNAAESGKTTVIELGIGKFTLYKQGADTKGKDLTFVGQGAEKTAWGIGAEIPDPDKFGTEYNSDYSFDGAGTITFKNMTLQSGDANYLGFTRPDNTVVENCTINGKTFYWGYKTAKFINTTFNCPSGDYALWTYSSPEMTFDGCTFNSSGKMINVYNEGGTPNLQVNINNCTFNNSKYNKAVCKIDDSFANRYTISFTGDNVINGDIKPDGIQNNKAFDNRTCSRYYEFSVNTGKTIVNINGKTVWENGSMVNHLYSDGHAENKYKVVETGKWGQVDGKTVRKVIKECEYCGRQIPFDEYGYTVTYIDGVDGSIFKDKVSDVIAEGEKTPEFGEDPVREGYRFAGWKPAVEETVTANAIYSAQWEAVDEAAGTEDGEDGSDSSTKTGDSTNLMVLLALLTASLGGGAAALYRRRA